ncbi:MAG: phosphatase PAP2 family protein [Rubrivivax sp.]|nr:phosphatase PAP2 family protein [Rubrivivax sp.]
MDALLRSRDGTFDVDDLSRRHLAQPTIDDSGQRVRWEAWVRAYVALHQLLSPLHFEPRTPAPPATGGMTLWCGTTVRSTATTPPVTTWQSLVAIDRPAPTVFEKQVDLVLAWAELREERLTEILAQIDPQFSFWASVVGLRADRHRHTVELINLALQLAVYVEMRFKHALACLRPVELSAQVQPMITTPGHGSFPSGHATQAYVVAHVLGALLKLPTNDPARVQLQRQAARIATNRVVAGVHFPIDSVAGRLLGTTLGEYFVARCVAGSQVPRRWLSCASPLDGVEFDSDAPLDGGSLYYTSLPGGPFGLDAPPLLQSMWTDAENEWAGRVPPVNA